MSQTPPKVLKSLVRKMFPPVQWEEIEGDLEEDFAYNYQQHGKTRARYYYLLDVFRLIKLYFILRKRTQSNNTVMNKLLFFHLKYGFRSLYRQKLYQSLNILTLTLGFSCFMLIFLFVYNQKQKDDFLTNSDQLMRLDYFHNGEERTKIHGGMPEVLKSTFPEIERVARISTLTVKVGLEGSADEFTERLVKTDPDYLDMFQVKLVTGNLPQAKGEQVLISKNLADKLFGDAAVIGRVINITQGDRKKSYVVSGILQDLPVNASFENDLILFDDGTRKHPLNARYSRNFITWFQIAPGSDLNSLQAEIPDALAPHTEATSLIQSEYIFRTFDEVKYDTRIGDSFLASIDRQVIFIFSAVALVILLLAIANYINLLAALSLRRTQEMSVKKVMGASPRSLLVQQMIESLIISTVSIFLSAITLVWLIPRVENFLDLSLSLTPWAKRIALLAMIIMPVLLTLMASIYPAILMSKTKYSELMRGKAASSPRGRFIRNSLLALQFSISTFLIIGTLTFIKQIGHIKTMHKTDVVGQVLIMKGKLGDKHQLLKNELKTRPEVALVSISSMAPGPDDNLGAGLATEDFDGQFDFWVIDEDFMEIMGLNMIEGQNFTPPDQTQKSQVIINEALALKARKTPVGSTVQTMSSTNEIVGIVQDFPIVSAKLEVQPAMFMPPAGLDSLPMFSGLMSKVAVKLSTSDYETAIAEIEEAWEEIYPDQPFDIEFMDDRLDRVYTAEMRMGQLFGTFTGVAILISCLGILGLLTYLIEVKMKELGIRKVLGASFMEQVKTMTSNLWKVMLISNLIAFPLSYYFLQHWLDSFAHRTHIDAGLFMATTLIFCGVVALSALWQVLKLNTLNPTEVLRNE